MVTRDQMINRFLCASRRALWCLPVCAGWAHRRRPALHHRAALAPRRPSIQHTLTGTRPLAYPPSGESIQGKGISPDIIVEQGEFESYDFKRYSESDLKDSLDKDDENIKNDDADDTELSEKEKRLAKDYQLQRALDLLKGLSIFEESFEE